jgi:hypothetical protein
MVAMPTFISCQDGTIPFTVLGLDCETVKNQTSDVTVGTICAWSKKASDISPAGVSVTAIKMYPYEKVSTATCSDESSLGQIANFDCLQKQEYFVRISFIGKAADEQCPLSAVPIAKLASSLTEAAQVTFPHIEIVANNEPSTLPSKPGTSGGLIAGVAAAGLVVLAAVIVAVAHHRKKTPQAPKKVTESGDVVLGMLNAPVNTTRAARVSMKRDSAFTVYNMLASVAVQKANAAGNAHTPARDLTDTQPQHAFNKICVTELPTSLSRRPGQRNPLRVNYGRKNINRDTVTSLHSFGGAQIMNI